MGGRAGHINTETGDVSRCPWSAEIGREPWGEQRAAGAGCVDDVEDGSEVRRRRGGAWQAEGLEGVRDADCRGWEGAASQVPRAS